MTVPDQRREKHGGRRRIVGSENARADRIERVADGAQQREDHRRMKAAGEGPGHDGDPDEAHDDRRPAAWADPFAERRPREQRHQEGRGEDDRRGLVELQILQREQIEGGGHEQQGRAADLQPGAPRREQAGRRPRVHEDERQREVRGVAGPHHLQHREMTVQPLAGGVQQREAEAGGAKQADAGEARADVVEGGEPARRRGPLTAFHAGFLNRWRGRRTDRIPRRW